jgi:prolyl 4-hydroxylase
MASNSNNNNNNNNNNINNNININNDKPLTEAWRTWLRMNLARGCSKEVLLERCVDKEGFSRRDVERELQIGINDNDNDNDNNKNNNKTKATTNKTKFVNNGWKEWVRLQLDQGKNHEELFQRLAITEGLDLDQVSMALGGYRARTLCCSEMDNNNDTNNNNVVSQRRLPRPPFTKREFLPRAWKVDTELVELYEIPNFLTVDECQEVIRRIDDASVNNKSLERSTVSYGEANSRTSRTRHFPLTDIDIDIDNNDDIIRRVEDKLSALMMNTNNNHYDSTCAAEPLQGQCYGPGEYFRPHCDWFSPGEEEYERHCTVGGQRTWTVMIYLNFVNGGGGTTRFEHLGGREFVPIPGLALAWNNLDADDQTPNHWTLHEAKPVTSGRKYVLTKWFRERPMSI